MLVCGRWLLAGLLVAVLLLGLLMLALVLPAGGTSVYSSWKTPGLLQCSSRAAAVDRGAP